MNIREKLLIEYKEQIELIEEYVQTTDFEAFEHLQKINLTEDISFFKSEYIAKENASGRLENHQDYIDVHYAYVGSEQINICDVSDLELLTDYDQDTDISWYLGNDEVKPQIITKGEMLVLFPGEAHEPQIRVSHTNNTKVVFKIKYNKCCDKI